MKSEIFKQNILHIKLFIISVSLVLSGCNGGIGTSTPATTNNVQSTIPILVSIDDTLTCNPIQFFAKKSLVLATDRLVYDQAEVNQISAFIDSQGDDLGYISSTPPDTLRYVTGSAPQYMINKTPQDAGTLCRTKLHVTNISQETLLIQKINLRYINDARANTQLYRLINVCSIGKRTQITCPPSIGQPGGGCFVRFTIGMQSANTIYSAKIEGNLNTCFPPKLEPGDKMLIGVSVKVNPYESGLFVSVIPEIVITSPNETQTVSPSRSKKMDIAVAAHQNVSCYVLKNNTFVKQEEVVNVEGSWCV